MEKAAYMVSVSLPTRANQFDFKKKISYSNTYIQKLERGYRRIYLQESNGEIDVENRLMDMRRG